MLRKYLKKGAVPFIGFILSPLSWWNDLFINIPLAYVLALPFGFISHRAFLAAMVGFYWLTNITGLVMLHWGVKDIVAPGAKPFTWRSLWKDLLVAVAYTGIVVFLAGRGWLKFPSEYMR